MIMIFSLNLLCNTTCVASSRLRKGGSTDFQIAVPFHVLFVQQIQGTWKYDKRKEWELHKKRRRSTGREKEKKKKCFNLPYVSDMFLQQDICTFPIYRFFQIFLSKNKKFNHLFSFLLGTKMWEILIPEICVLSLGEILLNSMFSYLLNGYD